jgi:hypothetical protein
MQKPILVYAFSLFFTFFHLFSCLFTPKIINHQRPMTKPHPDSFAQKISPAQQQQLIEWLAEHTYSEICVLIAAEPPDGFGLQVSIPTVCRFHKAHYAAVTKIRQDKLSLRAAEQQLYSEGHDDTYRANLDKGTTLSLQERLYEMLTRPVETIDDLKKLVYICKQVKELEIPLDVEEMLKDKALKEFRGHPFDRLVLPKLLAKAEELRGSSNNPAPSDSTASDPHPPAPN